MDRLQKLETISDIQNFLAAMYGEKNAARHFEYLYSFAAQNCAYLARAVEKKSDPSQYFISSFSWICALATKLDINLQDAFLKKFPKCCPYCLERVCVCAKTNKTALKFTNQAAVLAERKNHYQTITNTNHGNSASEVAQWLNEIYPSNRAIWKTHGYHHHFSRLFEELGEVYEAYCSHITRGSTDLTAISEELADCVAWLLSAWDIQYPNTAFIDEFINYYTENCPVCSKAPCECADHYARNKSLHTERDLEKLLSSLNKLAEAISSESSSTPTVDEAIKLIQTAANDINNSKKTQSTTEIKQVVNRSENLINSARRALAKSPEISEKFNALFDAYENIKNALPWT